MKVLSLIVKNISISTYSVCQTVLIQTIQFSLNIVSAHMQLDVKTVLFQTFQFSISKHFSSNRPIDRNLPRPTTPGKSGPWNNSNKRVFCIRKSSIITGTPSSDCLVSYPEHSFGGLTPLQRCSWCILQPKPSGQINQLFADNEMVKSIVI